MIFGIVPLLLHIHGSSFRHPVLSIGNGDIAVFFYFISSLTDSAAAKKPEKKKSGGSIYDFLPIVDLVLDFIAAFGRKLRVNQLQLKLILAGGDPSDLAVNYGRGWAVLGNLMPLLEKAFVIQKRDLEVECDFLSDKCQRQQSYKIGYRKHHKYM